MSPAIAYLLAIGVALVVGVILLELAEAHDRQRRLEEWDRMEAARDVTGRISGPRKWES